MKKKDEERVSDRRQFLQCMAWVGTGAMWTMAGGVLKGIADRTDGTRRNEPCGRKRRAPFRADQRQPYRVRQAGEQRRDGDVASRRSPRSRRRPNRRRSCSTPAI